MDWAEIAELCQDAYGRSRPLAWRLSSTASKPATGSLSAWRPRTARRSGSSGGRGGAAGHRRRSAALPSCARTARGSPRIGEPPRGVRCRPRGTARAEPRRPSARSAAPHRRTGPAGRRRTAPGTRPGRRPHRACTVSRPPYPRPVKPALSGLADVGWLPCAKMRHASLVGAADVAGLPGLVAGRRCAGRPRRWWRWLCRRRWPPPGWRTCRRSSGSTPSSPGRCSTP